MRDWTHDLLMSLIFPSAGSNSTPPVKISIWRSKMQVLEKMNQCYDPGANAWHTQIVRKLSTIEAA